MFPCSSREPNDSDDVAEVEQHRARFRHLNRNQQPDANLSMYVETLEVEDERTRKVPNTRGQQKYQLLMQQDPSATETKHGDLFTSPKAFNEMEQHEPSEDNQLEQLEQEQKAQCVKSASLWNRRFSDRPQVTKHVPKLGQDALWGGGPMHYTTQDARRQELYFQPQYFA